MKYEESFLATIKERYCLNPGSEKQTYHLVIDLGNSGIQYQVGDCLGIFPRNSQARVTESLALLGATGEESVQDKSGVSYKLQELLETRLNLSRIKLDEHLSLEDICQKTALLLPRFYSIASCMDVVGNEAHLTVGLVEGVCSQFLCFEAPIGEPAVPIFYHPSRNFSLPEEANSKPLIMIGPGTGIAPFRGFLQHRTSRGCSSKNWLFFGERHSKTDFYYQKDFTPLVDSKNLIISCAFSRDQETSIYVQHRMLESARELWQWIEEGAYLFVCGDASKMAKDVDATLHSIAQSEGGLSKDESKDFFKSLKKESRYQRDVY